MFKGKETARELKGESVQRCQEASGTLQPDIGGETGKGSWGPPPRELLRNPTLVRSMGGAEDAIASLTVGRMPSALLIWDKYYKTGMKRNTEFS